MSFKFEKYALGGFGDNTVVDVDALPTENIDQSKIYRVKKEATETTVYVCNSQIGEIMTLTEFFEMAYKKPMTVVTNVVDELPETMSPYIEPKISTANIYIIDSTGIAYGSNDGTSANVITVGATLGGDRGWIDSVDGLDVNNENDQGVYCVRGSSSSTTYGIPDEADNKTVYEHTSATGWKELGAGEGGTCAGGIIDVTELPTENIDENAVYKVIGEEWVETWYVIDASTKLSLGDFFLTAGLSTTITYYLVDALPATLEVSDFETFSMLHVYIVSDTGVCYVAQDAENVMTLGTLLSNVIGDEIVDRGWAEDIASIEGPTETVGIYAVILPATTTYGVSTDASTVVYGYNGYSWEELAVKETLLASANFTDYAELTGSADGIVMTGLSAVALTCLKIQGNVTSIGTRACNEQGALKSVIIPSSVTSIGDYAFLDCASLTSIIYNGTKEQWKAINFGTGWNNATGNYIITCTDGTIAKDGTET